MIELLLYSLGIPITCLYIKVCEEKTTTKMDSFELVFLICWPLGFIIMAFIFLIQSFGRE
jgi:hypothetical protein